MRLPRGLEAECTRCGAFFTGEAAFDRHLLRTGCQPPGDVRGKEGQPVLFAHRRTRGVTWSMTPEGHETPRGAGFSGRRGGGAGVVG